MSILEPNVEIEMNEEDLYCESQIVLFGELTSYGEEYYENSKELYYDEVDGKWISI